VYVPFRRTDGSETWAPSKAFPAPVVSTGLVASFVNGPPPGGGFSLSSFVQAMSLALIAA